MKRLYSILILILVFGGTTLLLSHMSVALVNSSESFLTVAIRYVSKTEELCRKTTEEEKAKMLAHMRREEICERERKDSRVKLWVDGQEIFSQQVIPLGFRSDGLSVLLHSFPLKSGTHQIRVALEQELGAKSDSNDKNIAEFSREINFEKNKRYLVEYQKDIGFKLF